MKYRRFGRTGWQVSEVGCGMWAVGGAWGGADDNESFRSIQRSIELGCNFFDTAWAYGEGHSEKLLGALLRRYPNKKLYVATKIPPKNRIWPSRREFTLDDDFPPEYIAEYVEKSRDNIGVDTLDLIQFHVWEDGWAHDTRWQKAITELKDRKLIAAAGVSVNRWEPDNVLETLRTGLIDAVQVIYNIFDQNPEDHLFPLCRELGVAIIARVPFDEGTLTGTLSRDSKWPAGDWRNSYFVKENLDASVERAEALRPLIPPGMSMAEMALRFINASPDIATSIPGMRKIKNVEANIGTSDGKGLPAELMGKLRAHRWDRTPTTWSQ